MFVTMRMFSLMIIITLTINCIYFNAKYNFVWFIRLEILYQLKRLYNARYEKNMIMYGDLRPTAEELSRNSCGRPE